MQRKTLIPVIAVQVVALAGLAWYAVAQVTSDGEPAEQGVVLDTAVTAATTAGSALEITGTSTVVLAPTGTQPQQTLAVQEQQQGQQQGQVGAATEPEPTGPEPGPTTVLTTTPPFTPVTPTHAPMAWCYDPHGKVWYSGAGEGCSEANPHFVEYRH